MQAGTRRNAGRARPSTWNALLAAAGTALCSVVQAQQASTVRATLVDRAGREVGQAIATDTANGMELTLQLQGLAPGRHGLHVHKNGECAPGPDPAQGDIVPFGAAGGHFDPMQSRNHGGPAQTAQQAHAGDLPNLDLRADGRGRMRFVTAKLHVHEGEQSVFGRALVVHEKPDDLRSDPSGNSGARVACGLFEPPGPSAIVSRHTLEGSNAYPEGVAYDEASGTAYVGSSAEGHLYKLDLKQARAQPLSLGGSPGRQAAYGMALDRHGRLWVAAGTAGMVALVDTRTGETLSVLKQGPAPQPLSFLNDIALHPDGYAYITDSFHPVLWRARNAAGGTTALEPWLDLKNTPIRYRPGVNLNGIVATGDGRHLLAIQSVTGQLWRIDVRSGAVQEVKVEGGSLEHGDGLVLHERRLYVVRNAEGEIAQVELDEAWNSGRVVDRLRDRRFRYPTTAAWTADGLLVVNGQLDRLKRPPPLLPFDVLRVRPAAR